MYQTPNRQRGLTGNAVRHPNGPNNSRSMSSSSNSPSHHHQHHQQQHSSTTTATTAVSEGPVHEFCTFIEETSSDDWMKRIHAFEMNIVNEIPTLGSVYLHHPAWYNTPKILWHLVIPINQLLCDPRSTVVRRVCIGLTTIFHLCQCDARLLFKDIMSTVLYVHGQTVQTIRNAVTSMMIDSIPQVPCKSIMPLWMERLKDKSPNVRDACSLYLGIALQSWSSLENDNYLTEEIWYQVGTTLIKTLRDPSPQVRQQTKTTLIYMQQQYPVRWETLIYDPTGPATKDVKLLQWLKSLSGNDDDDHNIPDDLSCVSKYTYNSESRFTVSANRTTTTGSSSGVTTTNNNNTTNPPILRISSPRLLKLQTNHSPTRRMNDITTTTTTTTGTAAVDVASVTTTTTTSGRSLFIQQPIVGISSLQQNRNNNNNSNDPLSSIPFSIAVTSSSSSSSNASCTIRHNNNNNNRSNSSNNTTPPPPDPPETTTMSKISFRRGHNILSTTTTPTTQRTNSNNNSNNHHNKNGTPPRPKLKSTTTTSTTPSTPQAQTYTALALQASQDDEDEENVNKMIEEMKNINMEEQEDTNLLEYSESQSSSHHHELTAPNAVVVGGPVVVTTTSSSSSLPDSPFIASMHELKKHASQRRSRNSIVMQERFKLQQQLQQVPVQVITPNSSRDSTTVETQKSEMENQPRHGNKDKEDMTTVTTTTKTSSTSKISSPLTPAGTKDGTSSEVVNNNKDTTPSTTSNTQQPPPEHIVIAIRLLRAHKSHVDQIMETLKLEMDTLRDFDRLLELPGRPTEEELITYYESMDLCLQQRHQANQTLQHEMHQLSTGGTE